jgi:hypothetical protein
MTNKHSPTPTPWFNWGTDHQGRRPTICSKAPGSGYSVGSEIASVNTDEDAAFIVEAVNQHEALLELALTLEHSKIDWEANPDLAIARRNAYLARYAKPKED